MTTVRTSDFNLIYVDSHTMTARLETKIQHPNGLMETIQLEAPITSYDFKYAVKKFLNVASERDLKDLQEAINARL